MTACPSASPWEYGINVPTRRIDSPCCVRPASGHTAAAPPINAMNSRRCMCFPYQGTLPHRSKDRAVPGQCPVWVHTRTWRRLGVNFLSNLGFVPVTTVCIPSTAKYIADRTFKHDNLGSDDN